MTRLPLLVCLSVVLVTLVAAPARSQYLFVDDFNDRNDIAWTQLDGAEGQPWAPSLWNTDSGSYELRTTGVVPPAGQPASLVISFLDGSDEQPELQNGYLRSRINVDAMGGIAHVSMRGDNSDIPDDPGFRSYSFFGSTVQGTLGIMRLDGVTDFEILGTLDPAEYAFAPGEDWFLEGGIEGDEISLKVWRSGDPEPSAPQLTVNDDTYTAGVISVYAAVEIGFGGSTRSSATFDDISFSSAPAAVVSISGAGQTYTQNFDVMGVGAIVLPSGWSGKTEAGPSFLTDGLGLTDGFLTVPGNSADGVLGVLNLGGNAERFGAAPAGHIPTWTAELGGENGAFGRDDVIGDNASDRALGVSRVNNNDAGELNFQIEIVDNTMRAFVLDWDLEIWGGDPDADFRSAEGPGMKVDVSVGPTSYGTTIANLLPGTSFNTTEDGGNNDHNATLIDGNVHSIRNLSSGIKEVSNDDGAVGNMVQINFDSNWNGATDGGANGWMSAIDNVRLRALAPGDADANGVVDVADLLQLLGGQKFNQGVDGVTWEQGDFNADDQFNTSDLLSMLSFLSGTFPSAPYASAAGASSDAVADVIVNSETGEVTVDLAGHTVSAIIIESSAEIFNDTQPDWDTPSQFPSTLPGELGNVLFTATASGVDELGAVISAEFLGRDKEFYLDDLDLHILIASEGGVLTKGNVIVVPEPSTWVFLLFGSVTLVGVIRRRR